MTLLIVALHASASFAGSAAELAACVSPQCTKFEAFVGDVLSREGKRGGGNCDEMLCPSLDACFLYNLEGFLSR